MEYQNQYASKSTGSAALTTGIIGTAGTALGLLNNGMGIFGNLRNNGYYPNCEGSRLITKDELDYVQTISSKDSEIALLKAEQDSEQKMIDIFERLSARISANEKEQTAWNSAQMVNNAQMSSAIAVNTNSITALQNCCNSLTKVVIPNTSVCPGWGNVTITPATAGTTGSN